jgi:hypothetical protein
MAATISLVDVVTNGTKNGRDGQARHSGTATFRVQADGKSFDYKYVFSDATSIETAVAAGLGELTQALDQAAAAAQARQTAR